jgi:NitT/TauT family transport system permease protein
MIRKPLSWKWRIGLGAATVLILLGGYTWLAHRLDSPTVPTWSQLAQGVQDSIEYDDFTNERWLVVDSAATGYRLLFGLGLGIVGGLVLGVLMGCFPPLEAVVSPPLNLATKIPGTAALALFLVVFSQDSFLMSADDSFIVALVAFGTLPTLALTIRLAVRDVPDELLNKAYTLGASSDEVVWHVIVKQILPRMIDAVRLAIGPALVYLIAAEWIQSDAGFGYRLRMQTRLLDMKVVYPYLAFLAAFGFVVDFLLIYAQRWLCPWYAGARE